MKTRAVSAGVCAAAVAGCAMIGGCYYPGGPLHSSDRFTYESEAWLPKTVTLIDTRSGEPVWAVDVPVGEQVVVGFSRGTGPSELNPDEVVWRVMRQGKRFGFLDNRAPAPPANSRRLDMTIRSSPELPGEHVASSPFTVEGTTDLSEPAGPPPEGAGGTSVPAGISN